MKRTRRPLAALTLTLIALAAFGGCGSSAPSDTGTGSAAGQSTTSVARKGVRFAECMRSNGVSQFPDPDASGNLTIDAVANGSSVNPSTPSFQRAMSACKDLEPAGFMGSKRSSQQQQAALRFAQCIRQNGVTDFPDPTPDQPLIDTNRVPSAATSSGMSILKAAMRQCSSAATEAGVTR